MPGTAEGETKITSYQGNGSVSHGEYLGYGCSITWKYFMGNAFIPDKPGWYEEKEYNKIQKNIVAFSDGIFPIYIHGTWSELGTFDPILKSEINKCLPWNLDNVAPLDIKWSGANEQKARESVANQVIYHLLTQSFMDKLKTIGMDKHIQIIVHSHGGNIAKLIKNKLDKLGWIVDVINISTPQRIDTQTTKGKGLYLNFYCSVDFIQAFGVTDHYFDLFLKMAPIDGARKDPYALNHEVFPYSENCNNCNLSDEIKNIIRGVNEWFSSAAGHSIQNDSDGMRQILYWIDHENRKYYK